MFLLYSQWLQLPISTRHVIAQAFKINKKNPTHVVDNQVKDDGYPIGDVERALSIEGMKEYANTDSNSIELLWQAVVAKAEGRPMIVSQTVAPSAVVTPESYVETSPAPTAKRTRATKITKSK